MQENLKRHIITIGDEMINILCHCFDDTNFFSDYDEHAQLTESQPELDSEELMFIENIISENIGKDITINKTIAPIENDHQWYETRVEGIIFNTGLMNWIRQFGPMIIVVGPEKLKGAITDGLEENLSYYKK